jgi:hypothetical protein
MGAKGSVEVETLIAQDSIDREEIMSKLEKQLENDFNGDTDHVQGVRSVVDWNRTFGESDLSGAQLLHSLHHGPHMLAHKHPYGRQSCSS